MAANNQGLRQASVRTVTGTTQAYEGDWHALFDLWGIASGDFNGRLLAWINEYLGEAYDNANSAMQAFAESYGAYNWSSLGAFDVSAFRVLAASAVAVPLTGSTSETALATISIPAGAMGANGSLRIWTTWSVNNNANAKTGRIRLGGISGTAHQTGQFVSSLAGNEVLLISNRNSQASQLSQQNSTSPFGTNGNGNNTGTDNTANALDLVISGQLANSGDTITLERYIVEILYKA